jgi:hypothetical protein
MIKKYAIILAFCAIQVFIVVCWLLGEARLQDRFSILSLCELAESTAENNIALHVSAFSKLVSASERELMRQEHRKHRKRVWPAY